MLKTSEVMTTDIVIVEGTTTVCQAVKLMRTKQVSTLIVNRRHLQDAYGIVTENDIVTKVIAYGTDPKKIKVYQIMTKPCIVINPDLGIEYVARLFAQTGINCAPVIKDELRGIISVQDIINKSDFLENPQAQVLEQKIEQAIKNAKEICADKSKPPEDCINAWKIVEELQTESAHQQAKNLEKTALEEYLEQNPDLAQKSMLDNWCSG